MTELADRIVAYRAKNRLSQAEMANKCGVSTQTISLVERGQQKPNRVTLAKIEMIIGKGEAEDEGQHFAD